MTEPVSRPPWPAVALFLVAVVGVGGWVMAHTYNAHDPGICGGRYARARTPADSAAVDRFVPDSERAHPQPHDCGILRGPTAAEFARADSLVTRAIAATGGDSALARLPAIEWEATVTTGDSAGGVTGTWRVAPPDTEVVTISYPGGPGGSTRLVVMDGSVWRESNGDSAGMTPAEQNAERHLLYLYGLYRLVPLRTPGTMFSPLPADSAGRPEILVRTPGRFDVDLSFGADDRVAEIRTTTIPAPGAPSSTTTVTFDGVTEVAGVRWFREMRVERDGRRELGLAITAARPAATPSATWIADSQQH